MGILLFAVILIGLIVVHEIGHYVSAKRFGIRVDEFGIGFPPRALTFARSGETLFTLNWLPFGGFVKIFGEDPEDDLMAHPDKSRAFVSKPWYVQSIVLVSGVAMNVLIAWVLFALVFMAGVPAAAEDYPIGTVSDPKLTILQVLPDSPAERAGLIPGAAILSVASTQTATDISTNPTPEDVMAFVEAHSTEPLNVTYRLKDETKTVEIVPEIGLIEGEPNRSALGISMGMIGTLSLPPHEALYGALKQTIIYLGTIAVSIVSFFGQALLFSADLSEVAGPVGIVGLVGDAASVGTVSILTLAAIISLHLAVINILPIPALDGGRLLFVLLERIKGSPIRPAVVRLTNTIGFAALILLMLVVTIGDIAKLVS